jgi:hypothetical protein
MTSGRLRNGGRAYVPGATSTPAQQAAAGKSDASTPVDAVGEDVSVAPEGVGVAKLGCPVGSGVGVACACVGDAEGLAAGG